MNTDIITTTNITTITPLTTTKSLLIEIQSVRTIHIMANTDQISENSKCRFSEISVNMTG